MGLNKYQTEKLIDVVFSVIVLTLSLVSASYFVNGTWDEILPSNAIIAIFFIFMGTFFGILLGAIFTVKSVYALNDSRSNC